MWGAIMFEEKCKQLRKERGYTQEGLAEICHVSRQTVSKWEAGVMLPEMDKLLFLSRHFNVSLDYLIKEEYELDVNGGSDNSINTQFVETPVFSFEKICEMLMPRRNKMEILYEDAELYDIIHDDQRNEIIKGFWEKIDLKQYGIKTIHDCSIGTGQMTIPLAILGYQVSGSDISQNMLKKCGTNCKHYNVNIPLTQCDFMNLSSYVEGTYDCVISTGNSLAHVDNNGVLRTLSEMDKLVKRGGFIYFDLRNWDLILKNHQRFYFYNPVFKDGKRINLFQVWDYNLDGTITFNLIYSFEENNHIVEKKKSSVYYFPISKKTITDELKRLGYSIVWEKPFPDREENIDECNWYQILAKKK